LVPKWLAPKKKKDERSLGKTGTKWQKKRKSNQALETSEWGDISAKENGRGGGGIATYTSRQKQPQTKGGSLGNLRRPTLLGVWHAERLGSEGGSLPGSLSN